MCVLQPWVTDIAPLQSLEGIVAVASDRRSANTCARNGALLEWMLYGREAMRGWADCAPHLHVHTHAPSLSFRLRTRCSMSFFDGVNLYVRGMIRGLPFMPTCVSAFALQHDRDEPREIILVGGEDGSLEVRAFPPFLRPLAHSAPCLSQTVPRMARAHQ